MRIVILADGNNKLGMGHVYRSLNLSKLLQKVGHDVVILSKNKIVKQQIVTSIKWKLIKNLSDQTTKKFLHKYSPDLAIIDKLSETKNNLQIIKKLCPIIGIDYTGKHNDLINLGINILYPKSGIIKNAFSNTNFSILDSKFLRLSKISIKKDVKSILILQGGADTYCFIPKILQSLKPINSRFEISIALGPYFQCWKSLEQSLKSYPKSIKILHDIQNMPTIMKKTDVAISAAGNTLLELSFLGIPTLVVCAEKFEVETAELLQNKGFGINLGFGKYIARKKILSNLNMIIDDYNLRKKMNIAGPKLVDGKGAIRIEKLIRTITK